MGRTWVTTWVARNPRAHRPPATALGPGFRITCAGVICPSHLRTRLHARAVPPSELCSQLRAHGCCLLTVVGSQAGTRGPGTGARAARRRREVAPGGMWPRGAWRGHPPGRHGGGQEGLSRHGAHKRGGHERLGRQHRAADRQTAQRRQIQRRTRDDSAAHPTILSVSPDPDCSERAPYQLLRQRRLGCC